jgi:hypothetical protein
MVMCGLAGGLAGCLADFDAPEIDDARYFVGMSYMHGIMLSCKPLVLCWTIVYIIYSFVFLRSCTLFFPCRRTHLMLMLMLIKRKSL